MIGNSKDWLDAQVAVLGSVMLDDGKAGEVVMKTGPEDYSGAYRTIYKAIRELFQAGRPIDPAIVRGKLGPDYAPIIQGMMEVTVTAANCSEYIELAKEQARLIQLQDLSEKIKAAPTLEAARELVTQCNGLVSERSNVRVLSLAGSVPDFLERHRTEKHYLPWGFDALDESLYCEPGDFVIVGGYPSAGKTALALQFGWHQSASRRIGFFSLETTETKLHDRAMSMITRVAFSRIKRNLLTEQDVGEIGLKARQIEAHQMDFIQAANWSVTDIQAFALARKYEIIYIDYLQLIRPADSRRSRVEQVSQISMDLHQMAASTGITTVALSQLSRPENKGESVKAPSMSSLRESGQLEQDADVIILLYKEEPNNPRSRRACRVAKNKEGETFGVMLAFDGDTQSFKESAAGPLISRPKPEGPAYKQVSFQDLGAAEQTPFDREGAVS